MTLFRLPYVLVLAASVACCMFPASGCGVSGDDGTTTDGGTNAATDASAVTSDGAVGATTCTPACAVGQTCANGTCQKECAPNTFACGDTCFDFATNHDHCGKCEVACDDTQYCNTGKCVRPGCDNGVQDPGENGVDCGGLCASKPCAVPASGPSCKAIKDATPAAVDGVYKIDPDGAGPGAAFDVFCDMTTDGGGYTALPLRFDDAAFWTITPPAQACVTVAKKTNAGAFEQYQTSVVDAGCNTTFKFVPPIAVSKVRLVAFNHSPSGACNSMDFAVGTSAIGATSGEAWYYAGDANQALGFVFETQAVCTQPYIFSAAQGISPAYCSRDGNLGAGMFEINTTSTYTAPATSFQMVVTQGGGSGLCVTATDGERFYVDIPPGGDGVWRKGIFVR